LPLIVIMFVLVDGVRRIVRRPGGGATVAEVDGSFNIGASDPGQEPTKAGILPGEPRSASKVPEASEAQLKK
jgi:hypothetical protein